MDDIRAFRSGYKNSLREIEKKANELLDREIANTKLQYKDLRSELNDNLEKREKDLRFELAELEKFHSDKEKIKSNNFFKKIFFLMRKWKNSKREKVLKNSFDNELRKPYKRHLKKTKQLLAVIEDKENNRRKWIREYTFDEIEEKEFILSVFKKKKHLFYGAEGEERAVHELSKLPDTYTVINDYRLRFRRPIYNRKNDDRIYSVQIDHIVVGPTGIYLIETKNWSKNTVERRDLFSPVKQLQRHNFAMFVLLNDAVRRREIKGFSDHWGDKKISPRRIILLTGYKPKGEYNYVKLLSVFELVSYLSYGESIFSSKVIKSLTAYLDRMDSFSNFT